MDSHNFKINSSSRVKSTAATHAVHQNNESVEHKEFARTIRSSSPSSWGDHFFSYTLDDEATQAIRKEVERLKGKVKEQLLATPIDQLQWLNYVNTLELLGVAYHFEKEIDRGLRYIYENYNIWSQEETLYHVSLGFRLLRQHGFHVPNDIFMKFKDEKDCFKESLIADVEGMLALFEASHARAHGEKILEEALDFTIAHLKSVVTQANYPLATRVNRALKRPLHRFFSRLDHKHYIHAYEIDPLHDKALLKLAKLNFNMVQSLHKKELNNLISWWKGKNHVAKLPFARDRMVELYGVYTMGLFEPKYSALRIALSKASATITMIDDIYDGYGTIEELELLTEAFERWDKSCINQLPNYMKSIYTSHLDAFGEVEQVLAKDGRSNCIEYTREAMKVIIRSYFQDAKWRLGKCNPPYEEYLTNALTSIACGFVSTFCLIFLGEIATAEVFEWASRVPKALKAYNGITRLLNDMSIPSKQRDGMLSTIITYMKHFNASEEEAIEEHRKQVDDFWKDLNQEMLQSNVVPMPIITCHVRLSRGTEILYLDGYDPLTVDHQCYMDEMIKVFIDPLPI